LIYDDYDVTCYALRGVNAAVGRTAGRLDEPIEQEQPEQFSARLTVPEKTTTPESPYFLEYPHAMLLLFQLPYWFPPTVKELRVPEAVLEARQHDLVSHDPSQDPEPLRLLWRKFRQATRTYFAFSIGCLLVLMAVLQLGYEPRGRLAGPMFLLLLPANLYFAANRFDVIPAMFMALSLACLGRDRLIASAILLAAATMVKVYPGLVALLIMRYLSDNHRHLMTWTLAYGLAVAAFLAPPLWLSGWQVTLAPYQYQLSRSLEGLTYYGHLLPEDLGQSSPEGMLFRLGSVLAAILALIWTRPVDLPGLLRRIAVVLLVFVSLQVFYSPQWVLWFMPLLVPLARLHRPLLFLIVVLDLMTYVTFPVVYDLAGSPRQLEIRAELFPLLIYLRAATVSALVGYLLWMEYSRPERNRKILAS
jgi:uncharacterized membrane protein